MLGGFVAVNGGKPGGALVRFLGVSPSWFEAMKIGFLSGRDFRLIDASPGVAIVNQAFANAYFNGEDPVGRTFETNRFASLNNTRRDAAGIYSRGGRSAADRSSGDAASRICRHFKLLGLQMERFA